MASKIIAHRGLRDKYPENTNLSIVKALESQIGGVEFDLELTADQQLVALHQETLAPVDNQLQLTGRNAKRAWVHLQTASEIKKIDAGSWLDPKFYNEKIPDFAQIISLPWKDKLAMIELKDAHFWHERNIEYENKIIQAFLRHTAAGLTFPVVVLSFNEHLLQKLRILKPKIPLGLNVWIDRKDELSELIILCKQLQIQLLQFPDALLCENPEFVQSIHLAGLEVGAYAVSPAASEGSERSWTFANYQPRLKELLALEIDYIITDFAIDSWDYVTHALRHN